METQLHNASLPPEISWLNNSQTAELLGISISVLRQDKAVLKSLKLFEAKKKSKGCEKEEIQLLIEFRQLIKERGRDSAIQEIWRKHGSRSR